MPSTPTATAAEPAPGYVYRGGIPITTPIDEETLQWEREALEDRVLVTPVQVNGFREHWVAPLPRAQFGRVLEPSEALSAPGYHEVKDVTIEGSVEFEEDGLTFGYTVFRLSICPKGLVVEVKR
jgi:hypothetical protein